MFLGGFQSMCRKILALLVYTTISSCIALGSNAGAAALADKGLSIQINKGILSVDIKNTKVAAVIGDLEKKAGIQIRNKTILPDRSVTISFGELKIEEGIKKLMHACGVDNYATVFTTQPKTGEPRIEKIVLVKAAIDSAPQVEVKRDAASALVYEKAELPLAAPEDEAEAEGETTDEVLKAIEEAEVDEETREAILREIKAHREMLDEVIADIRDAEVDEETRQEIISEIEEARREITNEMNMHIRETATQQEEAEASQ